MMVAYQVLTIADVANGLLMYVAQAFLLAGSIFGLDYYIKKIKDDFQSWESVVSGEFKVKSRGAAIGYASFYVFSYFNLIKQQYY